MKKRAQISYHFMDDPHMFYYIQSPNKVNQLLKSEKYYLENGRLVEVGTNKSVPLDDFVLNRVNAPAPSSFASTVLSFKPSQSRMFKRQNAERPRLTKNEKKQTQSTVSRTLEHRPSNLKTITRCTLSSRRNEDAGSSTPA